jgi:hypothetical protein
MMGCLFSVLPYIKPIYKPCNIGYSFLNLPPKCRPRKKRNKGPRQPQRPRRQRGHGEPGIGTGMVFTA